MRSRQATFPKKLTGNTIVLFGDSRTAQCSYSINPTSITYSGTTATATLASHGVFLGAQIYVGKSPYPEYAGMHTVTARYTNTFSWEMDAEPAGNGTGAWITVQTGHKDKGFFTWANPMLGGRMELLANLGVSTEHILDMEARVSDVLAYPTDYCCVWDGLNSYSHFLSTLGYTVAQAAAAIIASTENIYTALLNAGIQVIAATDTPVDSSVSGYDPTWTQLQVIVNDWIRYKARTTKGIHLLDLYNTLIDGTSATAQPTAGMIGANDHAHLTPAGARACGQAFYDLMEPLTTPGNTLLASLVDCYWNTDGTVQNADSNNVLRNGSFQTGAGGTGTGANISGTIAESWTVVNVSDAMSDITCTSEDTRTDGIGYNQTIAATPGGAGQVQFYGPTITVASGAIAVGDVVYLEFDLSLSGTSTLYGAYCYMATNVGGTPNIAAIYHEQVYDYDTTDFLNKVFRSPPFTLPTGTTQLYAWFRFYFSGAGGAETIKIGRAVIRKAP